ncbi:hypothetical protein F4820DRAFT_253796 [Hypoxylon rubiginosum]|uniref:Uncharacterized protein n=1 Tax=Hypoxylon rubiginosum TaxID=110542 RepID=A0ACB9ZFE8_9PEZI|nr:hypothetical protein F4820DRAFT_253796 [Hypoxylon rubiginosum]
MAKRPTTNVPDAWEDDWEMQADKAEPEAQSSQAPTMSKAERLAQHAESNRKIWESAEAPPDTFHYLAARSDPPLATGFKPAVKVLSRKPVAASGAAHEDDDDDESKKTPQLTPEEVAARQQREREEKQRRYDEARAKIFGSSNPSSGTSTPGAVTPPRSADGRGPRGRGGRGGGRGGGGGGGGGGGQHRRNESRGERDTSSNNNSGGYGQRPNSQSGGGGARELYDPNYAARPGFQQRGNSGDRRPTPREEDQQVIRSPRGPDGSGRGGFGFAKRGAKDS